LQGAFCANKFAVAPLINNPAAINPTINVLFITCLSFNSVLSVSAERIHCAAFKGTDHMNMNKVLKRGLQFCHPEGGDVET